MNKVLLPLHTHTQLHHIHIRGPVSTPLFVPPPHLRHRCNVVQAVPFSLIQKHVDTKTVAAVVACAGHPLEDAHEKFKVPTASAHHPQGWDERKVRHRFKEEFCKRLHLGGGIGRNGEE